MNWSEAATAGSTSAPGREHRERGRDAGDNVIMSSPSRTIKRAEPGRHPVAEHLAVFGRTRARLFGSGIPWIQRLRDRAAARFGACDFPTSRWEEWRYTDTRALSKRLFEPLEREESARTLIDIGPYLLDHLKSHRLVFVDGKFAPALSRRADLPAGVVVAPLAHALPEHVDVIESHLARHADLKTHPF